VDRRGPDRLRVPAETVDEQAQKQHVLRGSKQLVGLLSGSRIGLLRGAYCIGASNGQR